MPKKIFYMASQNKTKTVCPIATLIIIKTSKKRCCEQEPFPSLEPQPFLSDRIVIKLLGFDWSCTLAGTGLICDVNEMSWINR